MLIDDSIIEFDFGFTLPLGMLLKIVGKHLPETEKILLSEQHFTFKIWLLYVY